MAILILILSGSTHGLVPEGAKPLSEQMLNNHQRDYRLRRNRAHYNVTAMRTYPLPLTTLT